MRPFVFPDPNDRSINQPSVIVSQQQVLGLYNQNHPGEKREKVTDVVKNWFVDESANQNWSSATFHGNQCALAVDLEIKK